VRILAASSSSLDRALAEKKLREDLYYRLSAFTVHVPALRQRKDEIAVLLRYLMHKLAKHYGLAPRDFSSAALDACQHYSWPGNLRELETFVKRRLVTGDQELTPGEMEMDSSDLTGKDHTGKDVGHFSVSRGTVRPAATTWERDEEIRQSESAPKSLKSLVQGIKSEAERSAIGAALARTGWNRKAAARMLKVRYRTLLYKIEQYHMSATEAAFSALPAGKFPLNGNEIKGNGKIG
jgi:two-component system response regulator AtoC